MTSVEANEAYAKISLKEHVGLTAWTLALPFRLLVRLPVSSRKPQNKWKPIKRIIGDIALRSACDNLSYRQLQVIFRPSELTYTAWAKSLKLTPIVESLDDEDAKLLWIGPKRTDKVLFYLHGGGYLLDLAEYPLRFWKYMQQELSTRGQDLGIVVLSYNLVPEGPFPTPLRQTVKGIKHLINTGVKLKDLHLAGDSAGANLILQVFSHILRPHPAVDVLELDAPFPSAYLMSPWLSLLPDERRMNSFTTNTQADILSSQTLRSWATRVLKGISPTDLEYIDPIAHADKDWFRGIPGLVNRILVTVGDKEILRDAGVLLSEEYLKPHHGDVTLINEEGGIHDEPMINFYMSKTVGKGTEKIVEWYEETMKESEQTGKD